ncbi:MAG TPA: DUF1778 domain-containing protein [Acetobacteraceae bacterium]
MTMTQERETKAERLEVRLSPATKSLLTQAAQLRHTTLTDFLLSSAVRAAEDVLVSPRIFEVTSDSGWEALTALLDGEDAEATARLKRLLSLHRNK